MTRSLLLALFLAAPLAARAADPDLKADQKKMEGTWSVVSTAGPDKPPKDFIEKARFIFDKDTIKVTGGPGDDPPAKYKLSAEKGVGQIEITPPRAGAKPVLGLYKFEGDNLRLTFNGPGAPRPTKIDDPKARSILLKPAKKE